jgi:hypothetical protein
MNQALYAHMNNKRKKKKERPACKVGLDLHLGTWILGEFPPFPDKNGSLHLNCLGKYGVCWVCAT